mmetsp:Transcript_33832/g.80304  ORF Transcript_33832/g.80304 Transcript_33832/m.80304 type:complete len:221 (-) Transcript_33832:158-820(-)
MNFSPPSLRSRCCFLASRAFRPGYLPAPAGCKRGLKPFSDPGSSRRFLQSQPTSLAASASGENRGSSSSNLASGTDEPKTCREAIDMGLEFYETKDFQQAIDLWQKSLELPGSGSMRLSGTVREYSCPSTGEENAALFNMACAYVQLGKKESALTCIEGILENGFDDFETLRQDEDLSPLRGQELENLLSKYEKPLDKVFQVFGRKKPRDSGTNKPWLIW